jgi:ABC-2 type transport system permease protein
MNAFLLFFGNFWACSFRNKLSYLFHFAVPIAGFVAMFLFLSINESAAFSGPMAIGVVIYFSMIQAVMIVSLSLRDREQGVQARISASPVPDAAYLAGNGAAAFAILSIQVIAVSAFVALFPAAGIGLGFLPLLAILLAFNLANIGLAFLVCALSGSSSAAVFAANVVAMATSLLGGCFFPIQWMSPLMRKLAFAFPQFWAMRAIREVQTGAALPEIGLSLLIVLLFAFLFFALAAAARRRETRGS